MTGAALTEGETLVRGPHFCTARPGERGAVQREEKL